MQIQTSPYFGISKTGSCYFISEYPDEFSIKQSKAFNN